MATLSPPTLQGPKSWTDIQGLAGLRLAASKNGKAALPEVARQFESMFTQMLIKSMRSASLGDGILDSPQSKEWQGIFDHQIAMSLANDGKGLGIAAMLMRQLGGKDNPSGTLKMPGAANAPIALSPALRNARTVNALRAAIGTEATSGNGQNDSSGLLERIAHFAGKVGHAALHVAADVSFANPVDFVRKLAPYARAAAEKLGVSPRAVLAQAALETGWGKHMPQQANGSQSFNMFGIKASGDWHGGSVTATTQEYQHGAATTQNANFRAYQGPLQSFVDYVHLLTGSPRYAGALNQGDNVAAFAQALHRAGYATDPDYAGKLTAIANSATMRDALAALKHLPVAPTTEL